MSLLVVSIRTVLLMGSSAGNPAGVEGWQPLTPASTELITALDGNKHTYMAMHTSLGCRSSYRSPTAGAVAKEPTAEYQPGFMMLGRSIKLESPNLRWLEGWLDVDRSADVQPSRHPSDNTCLLYTKNNQHIHPAASMARQHVNDSNTRRA